MGKVTDPFTLRTPVVALREKRAASCRNKAGVGEVTFLRTYERDAGAEIGAHHVHVEQLVMTKFGVVVLVSATEPV